MAGGGAPGGVTIGVEEEFWLVDEGTGRAVPCADAVLRQVGATAGEGAAEAPGRPGVPAAGACKREYMAGSVEAVTGVCATLEEAGGQLSGLRGRLAAAARRSGALLVAAGTPVLAGARSEHVRSERYDRITAHYGDALGDFLGAGCHVHVGVPDRDTGARVLGHLRPWLPTLLALSANSPFNRGWDTGYASWRMIEFCRLPGVVLPPAVSSAAAYDEELDRLAACGVTVDAQTNFWLARLSPRYPTVELRVADTAATVEEALLQAALSRALVRTALDRAAAGREPEPVREQVASAALWSAARHGLEGPGVHPFEERCVPARLLVDALLAHAGGALEDTGDLPFVRRVLDVLARRGTGARRQRAAAGPGLRAAVDFLAAQTVDGLAVPAASPV